MAGKGKTETKTPSHFFKIILPSTMQDMKLRIPKKFVSEIGEELSTVATLTVPSGVFKYEGNSNFHVLIFDKTATEIQYPNRKNCKLEDEVEIIESDDANISIHDKLNENEMSNSNELPTKHEEVVKEKFVKKKLSDMSLKGGTERATQAARMFKPKNPSFIGIVRPYNIRNRYMYVPAQFAFKYLSRCPILKLETSDGRQWPVNCSYRNRSSHAMNIGRGWIAFCRENNFEQGDVCVFELIKKKPIVLKVSIFRVVDYAVLVK
uniref:TF-B3 domain-containing protein n=1 Tax=Fagus sylvatica TaxID=28930 RepID=A0A2N9G2Y2_FAGSY